MVDGWGPPVPESIDAHRPHEAVRLGIKQVLAVGDAGIGKHDVEAAIQLQRLLDDALDRGLVGGVEAPRVHLDGRIQRLQLSLMRLEMLAAKVAQKHCFCPILGELVRRGPSYSQRAVGAYAEL